MSPLTHLLALHISFHFRVRRRIFEILIRVLPAGDDDKHILLTSRSIG